jgi:hypothetical protein
MADADEEAPQLRSLPPRIDKNLRPSYLGLCFAAIGTNRDAVDTS